MLLEKLPSLEQGALPLLLIDALIDRGLVNARQLASAMDELISDGMLARLRVTVADLGRDRIDLRNAFSFSMQVL